MDLSEKRNKAYELMRKVTLIAENLGIEVSEDDFSILDKIDELYYNEQTEINEEI